MSVDWAAMYQEQYQPLVRFLHRMVWDVERAQELAQETFARAIGKSPANPKAWLFRVAANLAKDEARAAVRQKNHQALLENEAQARQDGAPEIAAAELERRERWEKVEKALAQLSDRDRDVLLKWDAGMSYEEIAASTGLALGAVGTTLARARKRLVEAHAALETDHAAR